MKKANIQMHALYTLLQLPLRILYIKKPARRDNQLPVQSERILLTAINHNDQLSDRKLYQITNSFIPPLH